VIRYLEQQVLINVSKTKILLFYRTDLLQVGLNVVKASQVQISKIASAFWLAQSMLKNFQAFVFINNKILSLYNL
jgi:hypothetical protein